jgi:hypothetical protein
MLHKPRLLALAYENPTIGRALVKLACRPLAYGKSSLTAKLRS